MFWRNCQQHRVAVAVLGDKMILFVPVTLSLSRVQEAEDGSVCFNNCNGHGECRDYSCHCFIGYLGDDCSFTYADESNFVPILTAGHFNLTKKNFTSITNKSPYILVGFSSYNCHKCIVAEPEYVKMANSLTDLKISFGRANADTFKTVISDNYLSQLPGLILYKRGKPLVFQGPHHHDPVLAFVKKQLSPSVTALSRRQDVEKFIETRTSVAYSLTTVVV
eukprot:gene9546-19845_t